MSLQEVGAKIMLHKATEYAKDASSMQKSGELMQSSLQTKAMADAQRQQQQIQDVYEPSEAQMLRRQNQNAKQDGRKREKRGKKDQAGRTSGQSEQNKIDIEI